MPDGGRIVNTSRGTALLLNNRLIKFIGIWRVIYYMPVVLPPVAVAWVWM